VRGRFAPSPTGALHLGNARTALLAWCSARSQGGSFVMRVEDLDGPRTVADAVTGNLAELRWLGLDWDEGPDVGGPHGPYLQSARGSRYEEALATLAARRLLAEDWLSRKDLAEAASAPHAEVAPRYGPEERALSAALAAERRAAGRAPALRARLPDGARGRVTVTDRHLGERTVDLAAEVGDVVVRRSDGLWAYHLAVVVDDAAMGISEAVRGDDLWPVTPIQVALAQALGVASPGYAHVPLLLDASGARMAKRRGGGTLAELRAAGAQAERLLGALAVTLGWLAIPGRFSPRDALVAYGVHGVGRGASRWSEELDRWLRSP
jgi:glutamyl-tRNA synthetase